MTKKNLRLFKNTCWILGGIGMFFLLLNDTKNNPLTAGIVIVLITGIIFNWLENKKDKQTR